MIFCHFPIEIPIKNEKWPLTPSYWSIILKIVLWASFTNSHAVLRGSSDFLKNPYFGTGYCTYLNKHVGYFCHLLGHLLLVSVFVSNCYQVGPTQGIRLVFLRSCFFQSQCSVRQALELKTRNVKQHAAKDSLLCCQNMFSPDVGDDAKQKMGSL